jgi:hypothetical protein
LSSKYAVQFCGSVSGQLSAYRIILDGSPYIPKSLDRVVVDGGAECYGMETTTVETFYLLYLEEDGIGDYLVKYLYFDYSSYGYTS